MAEMDDIRQKFQGFSRSMSAGQKLTIGVTILIMVVGFILILRWATRPDYALLFSGLDMTEADQIVESLRAQNVPYKITGGGTAIHIPSNDVYEWRMRLAGEGLPSSGGIGYEIFDKRDIGISDFVQKVNYRRALEGELARTIMRIEGIRNARVHIVIPKERLFKEDQHETTASIALDIQSGARLNETQVYGILHLVAASVEGLTPDHVTVVDSRGNVLSKQWESGSTIGLTASQLELQGKVESYLQEKAESMLSQVLGPGKSIVRVSADLNFQKIERTNERYDPDNIAILSEERTEDMSTSPETGESNGSLEHTITNYQVPKTIEHITNTVGNITRLSLAVLVDGKRTRVVNGEGNTTWDYEPRTQEEMTMLEGVVKNAVGFDPSRNDQFEITNFAFDTQDLFEDEVEGTPFTIDSVWTIGQKILPFLFLAVLLFILRSKLKKVKLSMPPVGRLSAGGLTAPLESVKVEKIEEATPETIESVHLLKQISEFAEEKPALAARVLRYWMLEE